MALARLVAIVTLAGSGCRSATAPPQITPTPTPTPAPVEHGFSDNWGNGPGCTPRGELLTLSGTIVVRPFGKGTDGALLATSDGEWIISYRATGVLLEARGERVVARGRACDKQGASIGGAHLDLESITRSGS
jgi:hypothetical protein